MSQTASIDSAIEQVERLYRSVTGRDAPPAGEKPYATIPPERVPEEHVQEQVDRLVETLSEFSGQGGTGRAEVEWKPTIAVWEGKNEILIAVDLPGTARDAVHVTVDRGVIQVHGARPVQESPNGDQPTLKYAERPYGKFRRAIPVPFATRLEQLHAQMRDGVLEIRVPRLPGGSDARNVPIA